MADVKHYRFVVLFDAPEQTRNPSWLEIGARLAELFLGANQTITIDSIVLEEKHEQLSYAEASGPSATPHQPESDLPTAAARAERHS